MAKTKTRMKNPVKARGVGVTLPPKRAAVKKVAAPPPPPADPVQPVMPGATCQEASPYALGRYIPCNAPATMVVKYKGRSEGPYNMCAACSDHNIRNRGGEPALISDPMPKEIMPEPAPVPAPLPVPEPESKAEEVMETVRRKRRTKLEMAAARAAEAPVQLDLFPPTPESTSDTDDMPADAPTDIPYYSMLQDLLPQSFRSDTLRYREIAAQIKTLQETQALYKESLKSALETAGIDKVGVLNLRVGLHSRETKSLKKELLMSHMVQAGLPAQQVVKILEASTTVSQSSVLQVRGSQEGDKD